jgi:hypothetical protein
LTDSNILKNDTKNKTKKEVEDDTKDKTSPGGEVAVISMVPVPVIGERNDQS